MREAISPGFVRGYMHRWNWLQVSFVDLYDLALWRKQLHHFARLFHTVLLEGVERRHGTGYDRDTHSFFQKVSATILIC